MNELGETIGILTLERLLDAVLRDASHVDPGDAHAPRLRPLTSGAWEASGATPLRRLAKRVRAQSSHNDPVWPAAADAFEAMRSVTVGGFLQESLQRHPAVGDQVDSTGLRWTVVSGPEQDAQKQTDETPLIVRIEPVEKTKEESS